MCAAASAEMLDTSGFTMKRTVTFSGYAGASDLENFPALVRLPADVSSLCKTNGADIRFADADGNLLSHEVDTWNANGESCVWVCVPRLSGTSTSITLYYSGEPTQTVNPRLVWGPSDYKAVWHFSGSCADSSTNALECLDRHQVSSSKPAPSYAAEGPVGTDYSSPAESYVQTPNDPRWAAYGSELTLSCWVKVATVNHGRIITTKQVYTGAEGFELTLQNDATRYNTIGAGDNQNTYYSDNCQTAPVYLTAVMSDNRVVNYSNGVLVNTGKDNKCPLVPTTQPLCLGKFPGSANSGWNGTLDEIRLRWGASSADWAAADYATQYNAGFAVLGEIEQINTQGTTIMFR